MNNWFLISLFCAFFLASSDAAVKRWLSHTGAREMTLVRLGLSGLLLSPLLLLYPPPALSLEFWGWMALATPLEIGAMLLYMRAIRENPLSLTLPYMAFTPVFATLTGWAVLGEQTSGQGFAGIVLVVAGSWLLNFDGSRQLLAPFRAILRNSGSRIMLGIAAVYAVTAAVSKAAMAGIPPQQFGALYFTVIGAATLVTIGIIRPTAFGVLRRHPWASLVVAGLMGVMVVTHFLAISMVEAAYMIAVKRVSLLFGVLYGVILFREHHGLQHLLAAGLMVAGVGVILLH